MNRYRDLMFSFAYYGSTGLGIIGEVQVQEIERKGRFGKGKSAQAGRQKRGGLAFVPMSMVSFSSP